MKILLVDDDNLVRSAIATFIETALGHQVIQCDGGEEALLLFKKESFPIVITDIRMPAMSGLEFLRKIKMTSKGERTGVIIITGFSDLESAVFALREGAFDYLYKPVDVVQLARAISRFCERELPSSIENAAGEGASFLKEAQIDNSLSNLKLEHNVYLNVEGIGRIGVYSDAMKASSVLAGRFHEDRSIPVLIEGETGTGKEVIARLVHYGYNQSNNENKPFVSINCSALAPTLWESELFGYEGGAFTGSKSSGAVGKLELSKGGTLFLDEIADIPLEMQPKLLRALQEKEIYRVGGAKRIKLDVRFIAATNRNLKQYMEEGKFRKDLFYRLNLGRIYLPPLRKQKDAILPLAQMFLSMFTEQKRRRFRFIDKKAAETLEHYPWPGNVRELRNTIERVVILYDEFEVRSEHLNFLSVYDTNLYIEQGSMIKPGQILLPPGRLNLREVEAEIVRKALHLFNNNKTRAAEYLCISRQTLRTRLKQAHRNSTQTENP